jgi:DNA (cytosine-5)-methyltransferase 1
VADADNQGKLQPGGTVGQKWGRSNDGGVEVICGGFPCQDISVAGKGAGIEGERSGLWAEYRRIIGEVRPRYVIVENVAALLGRGLGRVLGDLATLGYDAEWHCIPASAVGAPHRRDRIWIVAYPYCPERGSLGGPRQRLAWAQCLSQWQESADRPEPGGEIAPNADSTRLSTSGSEPNGANWRDARRMPSSSDWWTIEPDVGRVAHGVPARVDRIRSLGNSLVPQIAEMIGRAIMDAER